MEKLVVVIMGQNCEKFIGMSLESVKDADDIVYCDGGSTDDTNVIVSNFEQNVQPIFQNYNQEDLGMNGKQRNFYLDYIKENYLGWWCLVLDADEVIDKLDDIRTFINNVPKNQHKILWSVRMRHFIGDLGHEDSTHDIHFVPHRLFKVTEDLFYPEVEHPILQSTESNKLSGQIQSGTIWHLSYISNVFNINKKYKNHTKKSNMHTKDYLRNWYFGHIFGMYPKKQFNILEIPDVILNNFGIDRDEIYFMNRKSIETKHFLMVNEWYKKFKPKSVLDLGCGVGHYGYVFQEFFGCTYLGIDKSEWATKNSPYDINIEVSDITKFNNKTIHNDTWDLILCIDILEHVDEDKLDNVLKSIYNKANSFIFSIPFEGNPNLHADPTHKIKRSKDWWLSKLTKYFKITDSPSNWMYNNQILIGESK